MLKQVKLAIGNLKVKIIDYILETRFMYLTMKNCSCICYRNIIIFLSRDILRYANQVLLAWYGQKLQKIHHLLWYILLDKNILYTKIKFVKFITNTKSKINKFVIRFHGQTPKTLPQKQDLLVYPDNCW